MGAAIRHKGQVVGAFRISGELLGELIGELIWDALQGENQPAADAPEQPQFMTRKEAAEFLRISVSYLDILVRNRGLPVIRLGVRHVRFSRDEIEQWVKGNLPHLLARRTEPNHLARSIRTSRRRRT